MEQQNGNSSSPVIRDYEQAFGEFLGPDVHAFSFWKGRIALYAILKSLGIGPGDEVILPGYTCVVVPNAIRATGARPVYVDITPQNYLMEQDFLSSAITPRTRAILVQHTYGIPAAVQQVVNLARPHGIYVIEDCAHVLGTSYQGQPLGLIGDMSFFSFQWSKPYTTALGGMAVTRSPELAGRLAQVQQEFRDPPLLAWSKLGLQLAVYNNFYSPSRYWDAKAILQHLSHLGLFVGSSSGNELDGETPQDNNWRMSGMQASAGRDRLQDVMQDIERRQHLQQFYTRALLSMDWPAIECNPGTVLLRYPVRVSNKDQVLALAAARRVELGSWFETPLHPILLDMHDVFNYHLGQCPQSERAAQQVVNLPMNRWITHSEASRVVDFLVHVAHPVGPD